MLNFLAQESHCVVVLCSYAECKETVNFHLIFILAIYCEYKFINKLSDQLHKYYLKANFSLKRYLRGRKIQIGQYLFHSSLNICVTSVQSYRLNSQYQKHDIQKLLSCTLKCKVSKDVSLQLFCFILNIFVLSFDVTPKKNQSKAHHGQILTHRRLRIHTES